jgi:DNA polymerase/3'-5' exonuclease PolX
MVVSNSVISKVFRQIAYLIEVEAKGKEDIYNEDEGKIDKKDDDKNKTNAVFKARAYRRTADVIENLSSNLEDI